jgi:hypothetical protein
MSKIHFLALTALVPMLFACASNPPVVTSKLQLERVVVAPLNLAVRTPRELRGQQEPVWQELVQFLKTNNQQVSVLPTATANVVWEETLAEMVESDTRPELDVALASFARRLASQAPYDILVVPSLVLRRARVQGELARWDGVRRRLPTNVPAEYDGIDLGAFSVSKRGFRGTVDAASLHVMMLDSSGEPVFDGLGGLSLIQEADRKGEDRPWTLALRDDPFDIPDHLREGIGLAFEDERRTRSAFAR